MNSKDKALPLICAGTAALALLVAVSAPPIGQEPAPQPHVRHMSAFVQADRVIPPPESNPTPEPSPPQNTASVTATEPKMGDARIVDGQKQVYFLGFGWIEDNDEPNIGIVVDGDGDINKMVGTMDGGEVGRSCGDINKAVGSMD